MSAFEWIARQRIGTTSSTYFSLRRTLRTSHGVHHAVGTGALQALRMITLLGAARNLGPEAWGIWGGITLIITFSPNLHLGTLNAANRMIPIWRAQNRYDLVENAKSSSLATFAGMTIAVAMIALGYSLTFDFSILPIVVATAVYALSVHVWTWSLFMLRSELKFGDLGKGQLVLGLATLAATPIAIRYGVIGLTLAFSFGNICAIASVANAVQVPKLSHVSWTAAKGLARQGQGLLVAGLLFGVTMTLDRWFLSGNQRVTELGLYSFGVTLAAPCAIGPSTLADVFYARMSRAYGTGKSSDLLGLLRKQLVWSLSSAAASYLLVGAGIHFMLGRWFAEFNVSGQLFWYLGLVPALQCFAFAGGNVLNAVGDHKNYLALQLSFFVIMIVTCSLVMGRNLGVVAMAIGVLITTSAASLAIGLAGTRAALNEG
jgi:O-antigen/teichoic acid export membrane protein